MNRAGRRSFFLRLFAAGVLFSGMLLPTEVLGAAAAQRRQQQMQMQQQMQQQAYQQAIAQRQAQEAAAYQQAVAQRQAVMQQQAAYQKAAMEYAAYKQAMQQAVAQRQAQAQAVAATKQAILQRQGEQVVAYKTAVAQKQMAEVVAYKQAQMAHAVSAQKAQAEVNGQIQEYAQYLAARKAAMARQGVMMQQAAVDQRLFQNAAAQRLQAGQARQAAAAKVAAEAAAGSMMGKRLAQELMASQKADALEAKTPQEVPAEDTLVDIRELWSSLDESAHAWEQIVDREIKVLTVSEYMDRFHKLNIRIRKTPGHYTAFIDVLAQQMPGFLDASFMNVLSYAAIMEYDFENGTDKESLARQVLGEAQYEQNRRRVFGH